MKKTKKKWTPKYNVGDIVGVIGDAMYEFRITKIIHKQKMYAAKCVGSYHTTIKVGDVYGLTEDRIFVRLGEAGKPYPDQNLISQKEGGAFAQSKGNKKK